MHVEEGLVGALVQQAYLGRTFAFAARSDEAIAKATLAQVNAALRKYIRPEDFALVLAGDFKQP